MPSRNTTYGLVILLVALLIISGSGAAFYYVQYNQESTAKARYIQDLSGVNSQYGELATNFNSLLSSYNESLSLLSRALGVLNTSDPAYRQASTRLSALWSIYLKLRPASVNPITANVLFYFGNGTRRWYNNTQVQPGWSLYIATVVIMNGNVKAQWYPQYQSHFVTGIGGVSNARSNYWFLWTYNKTASWQLAQVGADQLNVYNGSVYAWTFCGADASFAPTCRP